MSKSNGEISALLKKVSFACLFNDVVFTLGEEHCRDLIEAHKVCLRKEGFQV